MLPQCQRTTCGRNSGPALELEGSWTERGGMDDLNGRTRYPVRSLF